MGITYEDFFLVCAEGVKNHSHYKTFQQILACDNFFSFKRLMIKRNKQLNAEALRTLPRFRKKLEQKINEEDEMEKAIQKSIEEAKQIEKIKAIEEREMKRALRMSQEEYRREQELLRRANRKENEYSEKKYIKEQEMEKGFRLMAQKAQGLSSCGEGVKIVTKKISLTEGIRGNKTEGNEHDKDESKSEKIEEKGIDKEISEVGKYGEEKKQENFRIEEMKQETDTDTDKQNLENRRLRENLEKSEESLFSSRDTEKNKSETSSTISIKADLNERSEGIQNKTKSRENSNEALEANLSEQDRKVEESLRKISEEKSSDLTNASDRNKSLLDEEAKKYQVSLSSKTENVLSAASIKDPQNASITEKYVESDKNKGSSSISELPTTAIELEKEALEKENSEESKAKCERNRYSSNLPEQGSEVKIQGQFLPKEIEEKKIEIEINTKKGSHTSPTISNIISQNQSKITDTDTKHVTFSHSPVSKLCPSLEKTSEKSEYPISKFDDDDFDFTSSINESQFKNLTTKKEPKNLSSLKVKEGIVIKKKESQNPSSLTIKDASSINKSQEIEHAKPIKNIVKKEESLLKISGESEDLSGTYELNELRIKGKSDQKPSELSIRANRDIKSLNPNEPEEPEKRENSGKNNLTLNPLRKKERIEVDPALLQKKIAEKVEILQAPSSLPPLVEESIMMEEFGESLAERQARLKSQRDYLVGQKKLERRRAVEKYLAEGGPDLTSKNQVKLSTNEMERRRNIIAKLKSFNES